jgi:hypothetical protein
MTGLAVGAHPVPPGRAVQHDPRFPHELPRRFALEPHRACEPQRAQAAGHVPQLPLPSLVQHQTRASSARTSSSRCCRAIHRR